MRKIILCEGKSDAILISYFLIVVNNWNHLNKYKLRTLSNRDNKNESFEWYARNDDYLAIWGVGGKDNFQYALNQIERSNFLAKSNDEIFSQIIIISDRDDQNISDKIAELVSYCPGKIEQLPENNAWSISTCQNSFNVTFNIEVGFIIIPFEEEGALETFLMNALSEEASKAYIITKSKEFVESIESPDYLNSSRLKLKGKLAVSLAIISPEKIFTSLNDMLKQISWEEYKTIQTGFSLLDSL